MNRELLHQAIATIGYYASVCGEDDQDTPAKQTIKALKKELEKSDPTPVAWALEHSLGLEFSSNYPMCASQEAANDIAKRHLGNLHVVPLYTKDQL